IRTGKIIRPASARGRVPRWLHAAIVRGLALEPAQRWPSMRALVDALERGGRRRRRAVIGGVGAIGGAGAAIIAMIAMQRAGQGAAPPRCLDVAHRGNDATTILVCRQEYARSNEPRVGIELANALRRADQLQDATLVANELLATSARGD